MLWSFETLTWRFWSCPTTVEAAARDFLENRNGTEVLRAILAEPDSWEEDQRLAFSRRVAGYYGLASSFNVHSSGIWSPGWNRRLLAEAGPEPEDAAFRILQRVSELARSVRVDSGSGAE